MNSTWSKIIITRTIRQFFQENKRFKGHSKWQNIMHTKQMKDAEKSQLFLSFSRRMKIAIAEGKSSKPIDNPRLASIIDEAKKKSMPSATISGILDKAEKSKTKQSLDVIEFRGPGNSLFLLRVVTDNIVGLRMAMNTVFKKNGCMNENCLHAFEHEGFIITEVKDDLDAATIDAINVGAEDVQEYEEDDKKFFRFTCHPNSIPKVKNLLQNLDYQVLTADEEFLPKSLINLNDENLKKIDVLYGKLEKIEEVMAIYNNINYEDQKDEQVKGSS